MARCVRPTQDLMTRAIRERARACKRSRRSHSIDCTRTIVFSIKRCNFVHSSIEKQQIIGVCFPLEFAVQFPLFLVLFPFSRPFPLTRTRTTTQRSKRPGSCGNS